jgi:long-chain acyl-CoA synthetase
MEAWAGGPASEIAVAPPVAAEVQRAVARVNKQLAAFEQIRRYRILTREFNIDSGELTATMKVRRTRVLENFREIVSEFYAGREESD